MKRQTTSDVCSNGAILDLWHPVVATAEVLVGKVSKAVLLGQPIGFTAMSADEYLVWLDDSETGVGGSSDGSSGKLQLPVLIRYGYLWTSLGSPPERLFEIPEFDEPDRRNIHAATIGVNCSAPRAIENFLDMGHFPYVHTGVLGAEPHTEVVEYDVNVDADTNEIWATDCLFYQPQAAVTSVGGRMVGYTYRVPHPYCVLLYKTNPVEQERMDVIGLFVRSVTAQDIQASMFLSLLDDSSTESVIRRFQQEIFAQDKPILENQHPKLLPLDPSAETPIRADKVAIAYRRWLSDQGVTYGVIPERLPDN